MVLSHLLSKWLAPLGLFILAAAPTDSALTQEPAPRAGAALSATDAYRIRSGDKLSIRFPYHPEFNEPVAIVRPDGYITLPVVDDVMARGLTVSELKANIEKAYGETLLNPIVTVTLIDFVAPRIFVGGQVAKPGSYDLRAGQSLIQAIILAGGFTQDANRKMVLHARPDTNGKLKLTTFNVMQMLSEPEAAREVSLQDGDYVFVPESKLSKVSRALDAFRSAIPGIGITN
jgi:polysaccharide export outer membrane protein